MPVCDNFKTLSLLSRGKLTNQILTFFSSFHRRKKTNKVLKILARATLTGVEKKVAKCLFKLILNDE